MRIYTDVGMCTNYIIAVQSRWFRVWGSGTSLRPKPLTLNPKTYTLNRRLRSREVVFQIWPPDHNELGGVLRSLGGYNRKSKGIRDPLDIRGFG